MAMAKDEIKQPSDIDKRKLGDEWADWDGRIREVSSDAEAGVFIGLAIGTIAAILGFSALFVWLVYPRLVQIGNVLAQVTIFLYFGLATILLLWLLFFVWGAITKRPFLSKLMVVPKLVNLLLDMTITIGKLFGISRDRLVNSFIKLHNLFLTSDSRRVAPDKMLMLLPRCLTKQNFAELRRMRDEYGFILASAGGGTEARKRIRETRPSLIIAIACERDLLTGFIDVNPHIPVIGFPNSRPCGPCKDTVVDLEKIEETIKQHLIAVSA